MKYRDVMLTIIASCSVISLCNTFAVERKVKKTVGKMKKNPLFSGMFENEEEAE